jgi:ADP-heptose:LPS heptosyltransferase
VGNDSGVSHLAAAAGAPTLALFGSTDPATWSPIGPRVEAIRSPERKMSSLDPAMVDAAAKRLLEISRAR